MFSHEELRIGRQRSARLRRLSGYLRMSVSVIVAGLVLLAFVAFIQAGGPTDIAGWVTICVALFIGLIGTWCEAISHSVADTYELLEDVHHALRREHEDKYPDR